MSAVETKREREKKTVALMIRLYCRKKHGTRRAAFGNSCLLQSSDLSEQAKRQIMQHCYSDLCPDCKALAEYAARRSDKCPFMESKTFCSNCKVHCYKPDMREKIREVMRFSGPRMILYHPVMAVRHIIQSKKEKRRLEAEK